jgi:hypothetical protein
MRYNSDYQSEVDAGNGHILYTSQGISIGSFGPPLFGPFGPWSRWIRWILALTVWTVGSTCTWWRIVAAGISSRSTTLMIETRKNEVGQHE